MPKPMTESLSRRRLLTSGTLATAGLLGWPADLSADRLVPHGLTEPDEAALLRHEVMVVREMAKSAYDFLWQIMTGIDEKEADWKPNPESNSTRWMVEHLCWFEQWAADTIENKGRYLTDKKPGKLSEPSLTALKARFDADFDRLDQLSAKLTPEQLNREITFVGRFPTTIRNMLRIHVSHLSGHLYQIRYVRGTYSRVFHTNKAIFDPW
ncbi:hypothetical protein FAES_1435 [Fibrella aestuarina BUZ 2]|uniref:DinB-like domain-containing protein n=2 Tax=Fibrella TaxID=861914 RepID=I0K5P2_9BACT|nr:hypothetical protein FAES_1435 [Fibrella aestuarina BUZ 2]